MSEFRTDEAGIMLRPETRDGIVCRRAAELALPEVKSWIGADNRQTDKELIEELMKHISCGDGYEIVKRMERDGWCGNSEFVEIMNGGFIYDALSELQKQWDRARTIGASRTEAA